MHNNSINRKRPNTVLYTEFFTIAVIVGFLSNYYYNIHPAIAVLFGLLSMGLFSSLFFANRIFKYLFSVAFSLAWSFLALVLWKAIVNNSDATAWVFMGLAFFISLEAHKNHFDFLKKAKRYEYEIE